MECQVVSHSDVETKAIAQKIASRLSPGDVIALEGDLGAGKTTFAQGFAKALGVSKQVDSPTFTIIKEYSGSIPLYHMDVYRLTYAEEELGLEEYIYGEGICLIEWASHIASLLPPETIYIDIHVQPDQSRQLKIRSEHRCMQQLCKELATE